MASSEEANVKRTYLDFLSMGQLPENLIIPSFFEIWILFLQLSQLFKHQQLLLQH